MSRFVLAWRAKTSRCNVSIGRTAKAKRARRQSSRCVCVYQRDRVYTLCNIIIVRLKDAAALAG